MSSFRRRIMESINTDAIDFDLADKSKYVFDKHWSTTSPVSIINSNGRCCYKELIPVKPNTKYFIMSNVAVGAAYFRYIDESMNVLSTTSVISTNMYTIDNNTQRYFTTPSNCRYLALFLTAKSYIENESLTYYRIIDDSIPSVNWNYELYGKEINDTAYTKFSTTSGSVFTTNDDYILCNNVSSGYGRIDLLNTIKPGLIEVEVYHEVFGSTSGGFNIRLKQGTDLGARAIVYNASPSVIGGQTGSTSMRCKHEIPLEEKVKITLYCNGEIIKVFVDDELCFAACILATTNVASTSLYFQGTGAKIRLYSLKYREVEKEYL